jgi:hypothetical protein
LLQQITPEFTTTLITFYRLYTEYKGVMPITEKQGYFPDKKQHFIKFQLKAALKPIVYNMLFYAWRTLLPNHNYAGAFVYHFITKSALVCVLRYKSCYEDDSTWQQDMLAEMKKHLVTVCVSSITFSTLNHCITPSNMDALYHSMMPHSISPYLVDCINYVLSADTIINTLTLTSEWLSWTAISEFNDYNK